MANQNIKAVILAGGKGTRLYPITYEVPKPLLPVKRKPIINYLVNLFHRHSVREIFVLIPADFREDFDWWKKRYYPEEDGINFVEEKEPMGTFGGLWLIKKELSDAPFFLTNGDELKEINLQDMIEFHQQRNQGPATIALVEVSNPQDYGVAICQNGLIQQFLEKPQNPPSNYISSGLYLLSPEVLDLHPGPGFFMVEKDLFPKLAQEGRLLGFQFQGKWMDCGTWERYKNALDFWV